MRSDLRHVESVELLQPAILAIARNLGVRAVVIKGRTLTDQGLRRPRESSDVDVLVSPDAFEVLRQHLRNAGWADRDDTILTPLHERRTALAPHSVTLLHTDFPCSVDLHRYYPGFLERAQVVFDELWAHRSSNLIANVRCEVPSIQDHWLLATLHVLRSPDTAQLNELRAWLESLPAEQAQSLGSRAKKLGASGPLRDELERVGIKSAPVDPDAESVFAEWKLVVSGAPVADLALVSEALSATSATRMKLLWRGVFPPEHSFRLFNDIPPGRIALYRAYAKRVWRGLTRLPRTLAWLIANPR